MTSRFLNIIHSAADGIVDLNVAAVELRIQKRRLYDITNVLEGASYQRWAAGSVADVTLSSHCIVRSFISTWALLKAVNSHWPCALPLRPLSIVAHFADFAKYFLTPATGIRLIEKKSKNLIQWKHVSTASEDDGNKIAVSRVWKLLEPENNQNIG